MKEHKTDKNITKYKKLNDAALAEHKTDIDVTKIEIQKLNMTERKTEMSITKNEQYKKKNKKIKK